MAHRHIQPEGLFASQPFGYSQVVEAGPGRTLHLSGQGAFDADLQLVAGDDVGAQAEQALRNVGLALAGAGARAADLVSLRIYVVDFAPEHMGPIGSALAGFLGDAPPPAQTLIGVQALGIPGMRVEIEATAVVIE
jgi:enamine deaminase RidA (YjgF/YER057c/UK114 family)